MYYCIVNTRQGKISYVYKLYKEKLWIAKMIINLMQFNTSINGVRLTANKKFKVPKRHAGLPMLIQVDTNVRSRVYGKIFSGQYTILQEYEYLLVA